MTRRAPGALLRVYCGEEEDGRPCETSPVHVALPISLSLHVQECELNHSEKRGIKHLNYSATVYRALAAAAANVTCADFCSPFRQRQLDLEKQKKKMLFSPKMVSVLGYCRRDHIVFCVSQNEQSSGNSLTSDQEDLTAM